MYVRDNIQYNLREDLDIFVEGEFESIFIESSSNGNTSVVGEIYRIHNSNIISSIQRYESILNKRQSSNNHVIIGTDQHFDYLKIDTYKPSSNRLQTHTPSD